MEAQIVGVVEKPTGWTRIETDGRPRFLDTKVEELVDLARQLMRDGSVNILDYNERESGNINPHTNKPYVDYYFNGVATSSNGRTREERRDDHRDREPERRPEPQPVPATYDERGFGWRTHPVDAWRMTLGMAAKLAIHTLPLLPVEQRDPESQWILTLWWANRIWFQSQPSDNPLDEPMHPSAPGAYSEPVDREPYPDDEGIPFGR